MLLHHCQQLSGQDILWAHLKGRVWKFCIYSIACSCWNEHKLPVRFTGSKTCSARSSSFFFLLFYCKHPAKYIVCSFFPFFFNATNWTVSQLLLLLLWCRLVNKCLYLWGDGAGNKTSDLSSVLSEAAELIDWLLKTGVWLENLSRHDHPLMLNHTLMLFLFFVFNKSVP